MQSAVFYITGTDTGVGKTVLTCLLARHLSASDAGLAALKPVCSGGRGDAIQLRHALKGRLDLDEINPWHFRAPISPLLAARREKKRVTLADVSNHVRRMQNRFPLVLVEGAGGLLSPLGKDFDSRDLILALRARPILVCPNRLGAINQVRLSLAALPQKYAAMAQVVLMDPQPLDSVGRENLRYLSEILDSARIHTLPWFKSPQRDAIDSKVRKSLDAILGIGTHIVCIDSRTRKK